ncbi:MAG TPA: CotH kinase family protein [Chryseolinea sp.]|nr:CotH kinase family protein [Chryseolinea sp.]HPM31595.1 CotH kinase family protein [Chryseolinea sp.]
MKKIFVFVWLTLAIGAQLHAQTLTDSNLPIIIITMDNNRSIQDEPKLLGNMKIIDRGPGQRNFVTDETIPAALNYNGRMEIEIRGSSSQSLPKKQYSFTTLLADNISNNNVELLGMPKENDWILNGLAFDPSLIRDYISYNLSRRIGEYAPRTVYCEVIINGIYQGLYILQEKIKADDNRADISKIEPDDNTLPDVSGGYITKIDKVSGDDVSAWKVSSYIGTNDVNFIHEFPKPSDITSQQNLYIKSRFDALGTTSKAGNISFVDGYPSVIDVPSFLDFMIMNELAANVDAYQISTYFHKDKNGKLRAGPIWDFNLTYGNDLWRWGFDRSKTNTWQFFNGDNIGPRFWKDLFDNPSYKCYLSKRWSELTASGAPLNIASLKTFIDETVVLISEAAARNIARWPPIPEDHPSGHEYDYDLEIANIKSFLEERITWMNGNIGSSSLCSNVITPPLVISKIMYNSGTSTEFPDSNDQEFIEITNNGNEDINLTGMYFGGIGFVYQFPAGSVLPAHAVVQLANHRETFTQKYNFNAFGEFTRSLNDDGQKLTLLDGFGNVIDEVEYSNKAPWPNADGNGSYLQLTDVDLDNNVATNWIASDDEIFSTVTEAEQDLVASIKIYPNPTEDLINVKSSGAMTSIQLRDLQGRLVETIQADTDFTTFSMANFSAGMYLLNVSIGGRSAVLKVVKH